MTIFLKWKERYIAHKSYNIITLRIAMYLCIVTQLIWALFPRVLQSISTEQITSLIIIFVIFSLAYIASYLFDVFLFYVVFKKYVNHSIRMAEKQVAPLLFLQVLVPFIFNLIGSFMIIPNSSFAIKAIQQLIAILYLSYIVFGNIFKEKCVTRLVIYLVVDRVCEMLADLLKTGISI